jgi:hypothetical protein
MYSNILHTLAKLMQSIHETVTTVKVSELKLASTNLFKRIEAWLRTKGSLLNIFCKVSQQFLYSWKCMHMFIICGILTATLQLLLHK